MKLQTHKNLRLLGHLEKIPQQSICYGKLQNGETDWGFPGSNVGKKWNRYALDSPPIVMVKEQS